MGAGRPTVSQARSWDASALLHQATEWDDAHDHLARHHAVTSNAVDESTEFWHGDAADAMRARHTRASTTAAAVQSTFSAGAAAARRGYQAISDADTAALHAIRHAELDGYHLADDGTATVTPAQTATALALGRRKAITALAVLDHGARTHTTTVTAALTRLGHADTHTAAAIGTAFRPMQVEDVDAASTPRHTDSPQTPAGSLPNINDPSKFDPQSLRGLTPDQIARGIPPDWSKRSTKNGGGVVYQDPANRGRNIRVMPGYPDGNRPDPLTHGPYVTVSQNGDKMKIPLAGNPTLPPPQPDPEAEKAQAEAEAKAEAQAEAQAQALAAEEESEAMAEAQAMAMAEADAMMMADE